MGRATLSFNQKEAKTLRKRARYAESRFRDTSDKRWLTKRDTYNDKADKLLQDLVNNVENQKKKKTLSENKKTDDQLINEAMRQNRRERNEREQTRRAQDSKKESLELKKKKTREDIQKKKKEQEELMKKNKDEFSVHVEKFNEEKGEFIRAYLKEHPDKDYSAGHREFFREYKKMIEAREFKDNIISQMIDGLGISEKEAEKMFIEIMNKGIESEDVENKKEETMILDRPDNVSRL